MEKIIYEGKTLLVGDIFIDNDTRDLGNIAIYAWAKDEAENEDGDHDEYRLKYEIKDGVSDHKDDGQGGCTICGSHCIFEDIEDCIVSWDSYTVRKIG